MSTGSVTVSVHQCEHCGAHVTTGFARVYGDSNDRAQRCRECDTYARLSRGSTIREYSLMLTPDTIEIAINLRELTRYQLIKIVRTGYQAAMESGAVAANRFRNAAISYTNDEGDHRSV